MSGTVAVPVSAATPSPANAAAKKSWVMMTAARGETRSATTPPQTPRIICGTS